MAWPRSKSDVLGRSDMIGTVDFGCGCIEVVMLDRFGTLAQWCLMYEASMEFLDSSGAFRGWRILWDI